MRTTILLTIEHQLHAQLLKRALGNCPDIEVIGETKGLIESMVFIASHKPNVWIHSWAESPELSSALSHVYSEDPNLAVIRINPDEPAGYIQMRVNTLPHLLRLVTGTGQLVPSA